MWLLLSWLLLAFMLPTVSPSHKVIVPAVFHEFDGNKLPSWINSTEMMQKYHYSVHLYQKKDASKPHYIAWNRGTEAGVYLRYIVDHYHHFPDIAVFVHGKPEEHTHHWMDAVRCIRPNATYFTINFAYLSRDTDYWSYFGKGRELWVEQCWREVLKVAWVSSQISRNFTVVCPLIDPSRSTSPVVNNSFFLANMSIADHCMIGNDYCK